MAATVIRNFIAKALFKKKGAIANNKSVNFSANALEQRLKNLGIDPNAIKSENELNQILSYVKQAEDQAFNQRFGDMLAGSKFDKPADVLDMTGKKIDPRSKIMGGQQSETEAEILARINKENKETVQKIKDRKRLEDRALEDFVDDAGGVDPDDPRGIDDFIPDPEDMATGGRAGFAGGSAGSLLLRLTKGFMQATGRKPNPDEINKIIQETAERQVKSRQSGLNDKKILRMGDSNKNVVKREMQNIMKNEKHDKVK